MTESRASSLTRDQLTALLAPLGRVSEAWPFDGGTFSTVLGVALEGGEEVAVKTSVPDRSRLLTYEHDLLRAERDHLRAVASLGVPAPTVLHEDFTRAHADVDVLVMALMPGMPWDEAAAVMTPEANARASAQVGETLGAVAQVRGTRFGLPAEDFRLGGTTWPTFLARLIEATVDDARRWDVDIDAARLQAALEATTPALAEVDEARLVHADLWHGNVLVDPQTGDVTGVVDFERSLYGDPLWGLAGGETHASGAFDADKVHGYSRAMGAPLVVDEAARARIALYRLWSMAVQLIEIEPRGFQGEWLAAHRASILANRERLHALLGV